MASPCSVDENEGALFLWVALMVEVEYLFASDVGVGHVGLLSPSQVCIGCIIARLRGMGKVNGQFSIDRGTDLLYNVRKSNGEMMQR